jgi:hypothetical protein
LQHPRPLSDRESHARPTLDLGIEDWRALSSELPAQSMRSMR